MQNMANGFGCSNFYLGLKDNMNQQNSWNIGDAVTYTNWASGEPNDTAEECVMFYVNNATWNDISCSASYDCVACMVNSLLLVTNKVFYSSNGVDWYQKPDANFAARFSPNPVVYDNKLWVIGGKDSSVNSIYKDVW